MWHRLRTGHLKLEWVRHALHARAPRSPGGVDRRTLRFGGGGAWLGADHPDNHDGEICLGPLSHFLQCRPLFFTRDSPHKTRPACKEWLCGPPRLGEMHFDLVGRDAFEEALSWDNFGPGASVRFVDGVLYPTLERLTLGYRTSSYLWDSRVIPAPGTRRNMRRARAPC